MAGFAAACYQRGIDFVQVPTTLLAQVDSSVGGKTGVNHPGGKNLIGAFHQPRAVIADTRARCATLPARELRAGLAEVIKYGLIDDVEFLELDRAQRRAVARARPGRPGPRRAAVAARSRRASSRADEREHGQRALLNLGHTFGHAIETATGYGEWLHGEAVGVGHAARRRPVGSGSAGSRRPTSSACARCSRAIGLPTRGTARSAAQRALELMGMDKKVLAGRIRLVLLRKLGEGVVTGDYPRRGARSDAGHSLRGTRTT